MPKTPYSANNQTYSKAGHMLARREIYPSFFAGPFAPMRLEYEYIPECENMARRKLYDGEFAIDTVVTVHAAFRKPFIVHFQERWREWEFADRRDLTITEWNTASDIPSEFYKLQAVGFFAYGYFDVKRGFKEVLIVPANLLLRNIMLKRLPYEMGMNPRSGQPFVCVKFDDVLYQLPGTGTWHKVWEEP